MRSAPRQLAATLAAVATLGVAFGASAQDIRNYGNDSSGGSGGGGGGGGGGGQVVYPGAPQPQQSQGGQQSSGQQKKQQKQGEEDGEGPTANYAIKIHEPGEFEKPEAKEASDEDLDLSDEKMYGGIIPGVRDVVDHLQDAQESGQSRSGSNKLTWVGFNAEKERTRVFVQTARSADYDVERNRDDKTIVVRLDNTEISAKNFDRDIDASYFDRGIRGIDAERATGGDVTVEVRLDEYQDPDVEAEGNYIYLDFPYSSEESGGDEEGSDQ